MCQLLLYFSGLLIKSLTHADSYCLFNSYNVIIVVGTNAIGFNVVIEATDANSFNVIIVSTYAEGYNVVIVVVTDADGQHCQGQTGAAGQAQEGGQGG